jgi:chromosome partitioning protein
MRKAEIAAFLSQKGGVGKTTSVVNTGSGLTILGKKVLVVDLDPQAHLTSNFGIDAENIKHSIFDVLRGQAELHQSLLEQELGARFVIDGTDTSLSVTVAPANLELAGAEIFLSRLRKPEFALKRVLKSHEHNYDYILIDCPPSLGLLTKNALVASHKVYIPVQTEFLALESLSNLQKTIDTIIDNLNPTLEIGGMIATRFDGRKVLSRTVVERMKERYGSLLLESMIRENIVLAEAPGVGKDIFSYRPRSYGAHDYLNLCREIMDGNNYTDATITVERGRVITSHAGFLEAWD